ncbi:hypothetical protein [Nocardioides dongkuii]|uniref:pPIWI-associating nuclease domain-containing protein n=1 Tax=Nocardioides dongkuii TaxID=2760089 RepID=UPI001C703FE9|nr:hypothetical protein [Nocardioides dongkuii]
MNEHNRKVKRAVDGYNREVRAHNNRVRANRQRLQRELRRLESQPTTVHVTYRTSVQSLTRSFERVDTLVEEQGSTQSGVDLAELGEGEAANSVGVLNALLDTSPDVGDDPSLRVPSLAEELGTFSDDLVKRWQGALFALNPANPDAARHFCTSAREVLTLMLESSAGDREVLANNPDCELTPNGTPSRRAKVRFLLARKGIVEQEFEDFVEADLDDVIALFKAFNGGTHGEAGKYTVRQLVAMRQRVESAIKFLHRVIY